MTSRLRHSVLIAAALALGATTLAACGSSSSDKAASSSAPTSAAASMSHGPAADGKVTGSIDVADQTSDGMQVVVARVDLEAGGAPGWIALHKDLDGKPGPVKYQVAIPAGKSANVAIKATEKLASGAYWPMLHIDDHVIGTYEFPQVAMADLPVKADGEIVMKKIMVTVK
ncbi:MAG: hypothetical protein M3Z02_10185 [Actinomycetota bacterium]|nr:hypothetical protein [Actinomycetota bacterium]